jgi:SAM-dependent methyltransferase
MILFYAGLFLLSASTLIYEIVLTRLLSVVTWYYLAFVSVSMAMFGLTAGALLVQLWPALFAGECAPKRAAQAIFAAALAMPIALMTMLAVPVWVTAAVESWYSFVLLSGAISAPFFFAGIAVCLSLTRAPYPIGRIYFADLAGAAAGCLGSIGLLKLVDASSAVFAISAMLFVSSAFYFLFSGDRITARRASYCAAGVALLAVLNAVMPNGIRPIWAKGALDDRSNMLFEVWNPISRIRVSRMEPELPQMVGFSPFTPNMQLETLSLDIDNDAETPIIHYQGNLNSLDFLRYDVTSLAAQLRPGGAAAIIGLGGGRDALSCAVNGFHRIVGIEVNPAITALTTRRLVSFSGFNRIPGLEVENDEGRSYLTRTGEHFDLIQASMVDTWAATAAGAMTLSENSLYTVDGWRVFFRHLKPGGLISFTRWYNNADSEETFRLFSVAWATLLQEGITNPGDYLAVIRSGEVATLILSNRPLSEPDLAKIKSIARTMQFEPLYLPGEPVRIDEIREIMKARTTAGLAHLRSANYVDYSPVYDSAPYFFNAVHLADLPGFLTHSGGGRKNLRAMLFLAAFMLAAAFLVAATVVASTIWWGKRNASRPPCGGVFYFVAIGLGFMLVEMAMMQQLAILLGQPIYSLIVVVAGLIFSSGLGSLVSDVLRLRSSLESRLPAFAVAAMVFAYSLVVLPAVHHFIAGVLAQRVLISLLLVTLPGFAMGFCFPVGLRWLKICGEEKNLPWMWALNGAAGTLGSFIAIVLSMDTSIATCTLAGVACYLLAAAAMPGRITKAIVSTS